MERSKARGHVGHSGIETIRGLMYDHFGAICATATPFYGRPFEILTENAVCLVLHLHTFKQTRGESGVALRAVVLLRRDQTLG